MKTFQSMLPFWRHYSYNVNFVLCSINPTPKSHSLVWACVVYVHGFCSSKVSVVRKDGPWPPIQRSGSDGPHVLTELLLPFKSSRVRTWTRKFKYLHQVRNESVLSLVLPEFISVEVFSLSVLLRHAAPNERFKTCGTRLRGRGSQLKWASLRSTWRLASCPRVVRRDEKKRTFLYSCCPGLHEKDSL